MRKSMNLIGQALYDRYQGGKIPIYFEIGGHKEELSLKRNFRSISQLSKIEKILISMSYGKILDVGCGTGNYIPALNEKGKVIGIDISPKIIKVAKTMGVKNCFVGDIFKYNEGLKFDTITMFENNIGMSGSVQKTKKLLKKLKSLLKIDGQILIISSKRSKELDYLETVLTPIYRGVKGESFKWINFNTKFLAKICSHMNLKLITVSGDKYSNLLRIIRK